MAYLYQRVTCLVRPSVCSFHRKPCHIDVHRLSTGWSFNDYLVTMNVPPQLTLS